METGKEVKGAKRFSFSEIDPKDISNSLEGWKFHQGLNAWEFVSETGSRFLENESVSLHIGFDNKYSDDLSLEGEGKIDIHISSRKKPFRRDFFNGLGVDTVHCYPDKVSFSFGNPSGDNYERVVVHKNGLITVTIKNGNRKFELIREPLATK